MITVSLIETIINMSSKYDKSVVLLLPSEALGYRTNNRQ